MITNVCVVFGDYPIVLLPGINRYNGGPIPNALVATEVTLMVSVCKHENCEIMKSCVQML